MKKREPKFKCHYCNCNEYDIVEKEYTNHVWEKYKQNIVVSKCCWDEFSIDYLYLHCDKHSETLYSR